MTRGFERGPAGLTVDLDDVERGLLASLAEQIRDLVAPGPPAPDADPLEALVGMHSSDDGAELSSDPVLARLLPDGYRDDADAASDFRRFTERGLREAKVAHAECVLAAVRGSGTLVVSEVDAAAWLGLLNDVRLALGVRLDIAEERSEVDEVDEDDPQAAAFEVYDWLTFLQDSLVRALMDGPPGG